MPQSNFIVRHSHREKKLTSKKESQGPEGPTAAHTGQPAALQAHQLINYYILHLCTTAREALSTFTEDGNADPWSFRRERLQDRPSTAQTTRSSHVNRLCLVQIAVDEWVAGRVDSRMPVKVCSEQLYLSRPNGSRTYDNVKLNVKLSRKNCC
eukprot:scaffold2172_cov103-Skeletonema_menzelii.AAC.1